MGDNENRCPTPGKIRFATVETAQQRAEVRTRLGTEGKVYRPYPCECGWMHLTTGRGKKNLTFTLKVETSEDILKLSPIDFRFLVSCDVKGKLNETTSRLLRTPLVNTW